MQLHIGGLFLIILTINAICNIQLGNSASDAVKKTTKNKKLSSVNSEQIYPTPPTTAKNMPQQKQQEGIADPTTNSVVVKPVEPSRILVGYATDSKSHLRSMLPLINSLASAGHNVYIFHITSEKKDEKFHQNVSLIRVQVPDLKESMIDKMGSQIWQGTLHSPMLAIIYQNFRQLLPELIERSSEIITKEVLNAHWDLMIVSELFCPHAYAFAQLLNRHYGVPYVVFSPAMMMGANAYAKGIGQSAVTHPHPFSPTPTHAHDEFEPKNFLNRFVNVLEYVGDLGGHLYVDSILAPAMAKFTGKADFSFAQLHGQSEMAIVDSIAYLAFPQTDVNDVLNAGAHCEQSSEMPRDYREFVEDPTSKGTIYIAFGTFIPWDYAPPHVATAFFDAFERLPDYRFIFSYRGKFPSRKLSSHIRLVSWAPQLDVLAHPKTKIFLTHCGLKSIKESLCSRTPMLAMPMFAEQNHNARLVLKMGIGLALNKYNIDAEHIHSALKELLEEPKYSQRVDKLQQIFIDRPMDSLDQGEFYIRRIIKKGKERRARHFFNRKGANLYFYEYFNIDFVTILLLITLLLI